MRLILEHPDAAVSIEERSGGRRQVNVVPKRSDLFVPQREWETKYPVALIQLILDVKGPAFLCDEIMRDEDPSYVQQDLERDLLAYFDSADLEGQRILDFGCGSGASTVVLARMFPTAELVGVDLSEELLSVARARAEHYGLRNVRLRRSPAGTELPAELGEFSLIVLSAVYEHLLPEERETILPTLWDRLRPGGHLFLNQTPNRLFPIEHHTTGLPLLNYLPAQLARAAALRFSRRTTVDESWETLLRRGIRGATEREILRLLRAGGASPTLLEPRAPGIEDRIDLWHTALSHRMRRTKKLLRATLKGIRKVSGLTVVPNLALAIRRELDRPIPSSHQRPLSSVGRAPPW